MRGEKIGKREKRGEGRERTEERSKTLNLLFL